MSLTTLASQAFKLWWLQAILMIAEAGFASFLALLFFRESVPLYHLFFAQAAGALFVTVYLVILAPIRSNIMQDAVPHAPVNWVAREVFLNIGRSIVMAIMGCGFLFGVEQTVFLFLGMLPILFPLFVFRKKVYAPAY